MRRPLSVPQGLVLLTALAAPATVFHAQGGAPPAVGRAGGAAVPNRVDTNAHDTGAMSSNFYHFAQKLFK